MALYPYVRPCILTVGYLLLLVLFLTSHASIPEVLIVKSPVPGSSRTTAFTVLPAQYIEFQFDKSIVRAEQQGKDLALFFHHKSSNDISQQTILLENFYGVVPPPTVGLDNSQPISANEVVSKINSSDTTVQAIQEALLSDIEPADLSETAAAASGFSVSASIPLFSYLSTSFFERFSSDETGSKTQKEFVVSSAMAIALDKTNLALEIVHARIGVQIAVDFQRQLKDVERKIELRAQSGAGSQSDIKLIRSWVLNSEQKINQFQTALNIALDDYENQLGTRVDYFFTYPSNWDTQLPDKLNALQAIIPETKRAAARHYWRLKQMETTNLHLQRKIMVESNSLRDLINKQFAIGRRTLENVLQTNKNINELTIAENDMEYHLYKAQAKLLAMSGRLPKLKSDDWHGDKL